jgi:dolichyl-phosphate beta-glucosyltransferase
METAIEKGAIDLICIVIPCYNEADRMPAGEIISFMEKNPSYLLCLVNDCSTDATESILRKIEKEFPGRVIVENHLKNRGKAEAVRTGMLAAFSRFHFRFIGYFDADLSTPLEECFQLQGSLESKETLEFSFGSRLAIIGSMIERKLHRHLMGRVIATLISNLLKLKVYDTQCGAKLFKRELAEKVFAEPFLTTWLFDVEIFARIIHLRGRENVEEIMIETPLMHWSDKGGSKIEPAYAIKVFRDLYRIRKRYFGKLHGS